ncbi:MAG: excinuclease ABC subunit UvrC [Candidatus Omnitrophica bacterium]|nr:excinuclease ABC subunit UvrC [Candidatus Omnitrophota bacterium]MDD5574271.1 excinuclease ABC subunit UvrC [Candidatus Omnitrophota bacterium]
MVDKKKIRNFPDAPGVYLMKDAEGEIIYVGKALSLKKRVASYFFRPGLSVKAGVMMSYAAEIVFQETPTEREALLLEADLIKKHQPRFNISLKDDKSYPYVIVTREEFPRVLIGRRRKRSESDADFFGPYTSARLLREALKILRRSFPFCTCRRFPQRACLNVDLGLCPGPCRGKVGRRRYLFIIRALEDFLTQKDTELIEGLSVRMQKLVAQERFEEAARLRDQLEALSILVSVRKGPGAAAGEAADDWKKIGLAGKPRRIEAFDISNMAGREAVGSMVSFVDGVPDKGHYRRFRIKAVGGIDDYAMIREVVGRRYRRLARERASFPDLVVIDGGAGHLNAARAVLRQAGVRLPMIAIAKEEELIYTKKGRMPVALERSSPVLRQIQAVRNEAHRFAKKYHILLRKKKMME